MPGLSRRSLEKGTGIPEALSSRDAGVCFSEDRYLVDAPTGGAAGPPMSVSRFWRLAIARSER